MAKVFPDFVAALDGNPRDVTFGSVADVREWIEHEKKAWSWVGSIGEPGLKVYRTLGEQWTEIQNTLAHLESVDASQSGLVATSTASLKAAIEEVYGNERVVHRDSERGKYVMRRKEVQGAESAVYTLGYFMSVSILPTIPTAFNQGVADAIFYETGFEGRVQEFITATGENVAKLEEAAKKNLATMRAAFHEEVAFRHPAQLWTEKRDYHRGLARRFMFVSVLAFVAGGSVLIALAVYLFGDDKPAIVTSVPFAVVALVTIWICRLLVKMLMSHVHLGTDAEERALLVKMYVALVDEGKAFRRTDRHLVIQALFRNAATGIVRDDDQGPQTAPEVIARVLTGKGE